MAQSPAGGQPTCASIGSSFEIPRKPAGCVCAGTGKLDISDLLSLAKRCLSKIGSRLLLAWAWLQEFRPSSTRAEWWKDKIAATQRGDQRVREALEEQGRHV